MTTPPSPPNRRRRRIFVVAIAVLVLGLGWWFSPRVDQRFVGKWSYSIDGASPVGTIEFKTDRTFTYIEKGTGQVYFYFWKVDGDQLVQGDRSVEFTRLMNLLLDRVTKSLTGRPAMPPLKEFQILAVQPDLITFLDRDRTRSTVTLRRLRDE